MDKSSGFIQRPGIILHVRVAGGGGVGGFDVTGFIRRFGPAPLDRKREISPHAIKQTSISPCTSVDYMLFSDVVTSYIKLLKTLWI